ncbi:MAG: UDP-N-acetylmuramoyl-L-alanine--D-glutamate ligase [Candidatus Liptonbacteria bacterium]|nr:UDP-N-acetylmuramoyl-L-alanine--D-glutamate ligase [Candidatus Liptonbacteria bacterium]
MIKKIAILGLGKEGRAVVRFAKKQNKQDEIWILDKLPLGPKGLNVPKIKNINFNCGKDYLKNLNQFDIVFRSPGVPYNLPEIQKAIKAGVNFSSGTHLFFENYKGLIIGVAGTKGKGTTSTLIYKILQAASKSKIKNPFQGRKIFLAGNIGIPMLDILPKLDEKSISILELSSFQMQDLKKSPNIAVVLGFFPDHLDIHKNFKEYIEAEEVIAKYQGSKDVVFYFSENKYSKKIAQNNKAKKISVNHQEPENSFLSKKDFTKIREIIKIPGEHSFKNTIMAATVACFLKAPKEIIFKAISDFKGNEHRLELVRTIYINLPKHLSLYPNNDKRKHTSASIEIYNDSASTTPETTAAAIQSFNEPKILIAGGKDKSLNYLPLTQALKNFNVKSIILFGENKDKIAKTINKYQVSSDECKVILVKNMKIAINLAYKFAKSLIIKSHTPNLIIVFSPGSTSFDMFKDYADRGEKFKKLVKQLKS